MFIKINGYRVNMNEIIFYRPDGYYCIYIKCINGNDFTIKYENGVTKGSSERMRNLDLERMDTELNTLNCLR